MHSAYVSRMTDSATRCREIANVRIEKDDTVAVEQYRGGGGQVDKTPVRLTRRDDIG
jgi:hypothetical protein